MQKDKERIERFLNGDESGFNELVREYYERVYRLFYHMTFNHDDADEMTQLTFIKTYKGLKKFKAESTFSTWLYRIAYNTGMSYLKKERRRHLLSLDNLKGKVHDEISSEAKPNLIRWIKKLPEKQRIVMLMRLNQELPFKDIGNILGISVNTAKAHFSIAVSNLRKILVKEGITNHEL